MTLERGYVAEDFVSNKRTADIVVCGYKILDTHGHVTVWVKHLRYSPDKGPFAGPEPVINVRVHVRELPSRPGVGDIHEEGSVFVTDKQRSGRGRNRDSRNRRQVVSCQRGNVGRFAEHKG